MLQPVMSFDLRPLLRRVAHDVSKRASRLADRLRAGTVMVEYAIMASLIAIVALAAVQALGTGIVAVFQRILSSISGIG